MEKPNNCSCSCHDGAKIFCSCFGPCCQEPYVSRDKLKPVIEQITRIGTFTRFVFPVIKPKEEIYKNGKTSENQGEGSVSD